jgi:DNA-binding MarR family transcriptional regulator
MKSPIVAYPRHRGLPRRGYLREERRRYALSESGRKLVARLDAAHREGIHAYVDTLDREERGQLLNAFAQAR